MPQVRTVVRREDRSGSRLVPTPRDGAASTPVAHGADGRSELFYVRMKKVPGPICRSFWHPVVEGHENIPTDGPAAITSNHLSVLDSAFTALAADRRVTFLARIEDVTPPGPGDVAEKTLDRGELLGIFFPEGAVPAGDQGEPETDAAGGDRHGVDPGTVRPAPGGPVRRTIRGLPGNRRSTLN
jgi:hypothetical protein